MNTLLTEDDLMRKSPSVFAAKPFHGMSDRYAFIPTIDIIRGLRTEGFAPFSVTQSRSRTEGKAGFAKHMIRFRHVDAKPMAEFGGLVPEIVGINSHDGSSVFKLFSGAFRGICSNGMICGDMFSNVSVRHSGNVDNIIDAAYQVVDDFPKMLESVDRMSNITLDSDEQTALADAAIQLRYPALVEKNETLPLAPKQVLRPNRVGDIGDDLWRVFNRIQENLTKGGVRTTTTRRRTRAITGIGENAKVNRDLWTLAESMAELKA